MSADWPLVRIADIAKNIAIGPFGSRMKSDCYVPSGVPVIRGTNLTGGKTFSGDWVFVSENMADQLGNCSVTSGDLVFPHRGAIGEVGIVTDDFPRYVMSSSLMKLTCNRLKAEPVYVYYFFKSKQGRHELLKNASQVGTPGIGQPLTSLKGIEIPLPPLAVQREIAHILNNLDQKIELNRQINQTLEQIAQAIFKSWFVDFEPVKAKIEARAAGRDPERAAMCAIRGKTDTELDQLPPEQRQQLAATAALFPDELAESELGLIPKGWEVSVIGKEVAVVGGGTPSTTNPDFWENGIYHWTTPKDLSGLPDKILTNTERKITEAGLAKISSGLLPVNTVLMSSRAPVGYLALAKVPVAVNQGYIAMRCEKRLPATYVLQWAGSVMDDIKQRASGTTFAEISKKIFKEIPVVSPDGRVLGSFSQLADDIYEKISGTLYESQALAKIRDTLLPKLLSGEIHAPDAEKVGFCS